ncbi:MAG TPA: carboxypeptidase regulatory-like domain-containing protein [Patescibacteria group bacterium]|nr:carboxypeptidase regulatory-like domain-containing protein [Patescibacteria group bacterium]
MRHWKTTLAVVAMAGVLVAAAIAQSVGGVNGSVEDDTGKPWQGVTVTIDNAKTGAHFTATTDAAGKYSFEKVPAGDYKITFDTPEYPPQSSQIHISSGSPLKQDLNFQKLIGQNPKLAAQLRKQKQFTQVKKRFDEGVGAMKQAQALQTQLQTEPAAQHAATQQQIAQLSQTAITALLAAQQAESPTDTNMPVILGNLGLAYEFAGKHDQAADSFSKAAVLKPTDPGLLLGAATNLAYSGKIDEASADCDKVATLSPQTGGTCWRNIGVVLYNTSQMQKAVGPLQKAAQADPSYPDTWYLLGEALMNAMQSKMVNGKLTAIIQPGTAEAFQKYLTLAPTGPHAGDAKQALQVLQQLGAGVNTQFVAPGAEKDKNKKKRR